MAFLDFFFEGVEAFEDVLGGIVVDGFVFDFFVAVQGEVVVVFYEVGFWDEETLVAAFAFLFSFEVLPPFKEVGEVRFFGLRAAFVVEGEAIGLHVVEPDVVGAAGVGFGEEEDGGGDAGVGLKDAGGHGDDGIELLVLDEHLSDSFMGFGAAEEDAIGHDDGGAATGLKEAEEEG